MDRKKGIYVALLSLAVIAVFVILDTVSLPTSTFLWAEFHNFGHTPLFGGLALALLGLSILLLSRHLPNRLAHYALAFVIAFMLGVISEATQILGPRDADLWDQVRNTAGIVSFLGLWLVHDKRTIESIPWMSRGRLTLIRWAAIGILAVSVLPTILWADAYIHRYRHFPTLCSFEYYQERMFIRPHQSDVKIVLPPEGWNANRTGNAARVTFRPGAVFPGFILSDPYPDWTGYDYLTFDVYSENESTVSIYMTIEDDRHNREYGDRFNKALRIEPGANHIGIPLSDIRRAPADREMDMRAVASINIFGHQPKAPFSLYFDNFELQ